MKDLNVKQNELVAKLVTWGFIHTSEGMKLTNTYDDAVMKEAVFPLEYFNNNQLDGIISSQIAYTLNQKITNYMQSKHMLYDIRDGSFNTQWFISDDQGKLKLEDISWIPQFDSGRVKDPVDSHKFFAFKSILSGIHTLNLYEYNGMRCPEAFDKIHDKLTKLMN